jgi:hypothetical protein
MNEQCIRAGRDLAAERVRADLHIHHIATAMGVSRTRIFTLEHSDHVTARMTVRYLDAVRAATRKMKTIETAAGFHSDGPTEATDEPGHHFTTG